VSLALLVVCAGCLPEANAPIEKDVRVFQEEQSAEKLTARGRAFAAVGDTTRAQEYFDSAVSAGGDQRVLTPLLLRVCIRDGRYRMAVEYAERYLKRHPTDPRMRFLLGTLYAALGEPVAAEQQLSLAARTDVDNAALHYALAVVLRDQIGDAVRADSHFRAYLRLAPDGEHAEDARSSLFEEVP